jgi:hypothetical protein
VKHRLTDHSGYLIIDHTNSPGINPNDIPARLRAITPIIPEGKVFEADIQFCTHCQRSIILRPDRERPRGYCQKCDHYICDTCIGSDCYSIKKFMDIVERAVNQTGV